MFTAKIKTKVNQAEMRAGLVESATLLVRDASQRTLLNYRLLAPKDTGELAASGELLPVRPSGTHAVTGGMRATARHATWVELGTGIYVPPGLPITSGSVGVMRFFWKKKGAVVFAVKVKGQPGQHPMRRSLQLACLPPWKIRILR